MLISHSTDKNRKFSMWPTVKWSTWPTVSLMFEFKPKIIKGKTESSHTGIAEGLLHTSFLFPGFKG